MHHEPLPEAPTGLLVVGSFPPVGGPASAASVAAVRRAWACGDEVTTASLRPGAADLVARVAGPAAGWQLERARVAAGGPPRLILGLEAGQLAPVQPGGGRAAQALRTAVAGVGVIGLIVALDRFDEVGILLSGPLRLPAPLLKLLWRHVDAVVIPADGQAWAAAAAVPTTLISVVDPYTVTPTDPGVTAVGPREVRPRDLPVVAAGIIGRRLLGRHFLAVRSQTIRVLRRAVREVAARRG